MCNLSVELRNQITCGKQAQVLSQAHTQKHCNVKIGGENNFNVGDEEVLGRLHEEKGKIIC